MKYSATTTATDLKPFTIFGNAVKLRLRKRSSSRKRVCREDWKSCKSTTRSPWSYNEMSTCLLFSPKYVKNVHYTTANNRLTVERHLQVVQRKQRWADTGEGPMAERVPGQSTLLWDNIVKYLNSFSDDN